MTYNYECDWRIIQVNRGSLKFTMNHKEKSDEDRKQPYTTQEVAHIFGVTARTVQIWSDNGYINVSKTPGGHRRISKDEVARLRRSLNNIPTDVTGTLNQEGIKSDKDSEKFTILVVEDDHDLRELYRLEMEEWYPSFDLLIVNDGYQALLIAGEKIPDVIITDLHMPHIDGFHLIDVLSRNKSLENSTIVVVTGLSQEEIGKRYLFKESVTIIEKPIPFERLKNIVLDKSKNRILKKS